MTSEHDIPDPDECVFPRLLRRHALATPDAPFVLFADGSSWSYADAWQETLRAASGLRALGVRRGDRVMAWLPNGPDILRTWFGANQLGAVFSPINTAFRGRVLEHVVGKTDPHLIVAHADLVGRLDGIASPPAAQVVTIAPGEPGPWPAEPDGDEALAECPAEPWDPYAIIYTSGTTGPSKGVVSSYVHGWASVMPTARMFDASARSLTSLPLFHAGATLDVIAALALGSSLALVDGFDTASFWDVVERSQATVCTLLGVMLSFLVKAPPDERERGASLKAVFAVPLTEDAAVFAERFGCDVYTAFNMTEVSTPLLTGSNPTALGTCGRPREGVEVRVVDEHDQEVATGEVGELIVRADMPWSMNSGYWREPEATARAWRNGWFHTGDAFHVDADGDYYFVDRVKDAIRRRGENISSFEVEAEILSHPAVREAAVVAVSSEHSEDDVLAVLAPQAGGQIDPLQLIEYLAARMPHFMVPRYVRVLDELPKTLTNKVQKQELRAAGVTDDTWDREAAGIRLRRERLGQA
ncbi:AMP-binding protein [Conexibacter woesei]|uniref:AMP-dependent synthetase and ligase n=1 Tax=Conexibacter woesei (strain DSM 14684 / CCUG 47730 / CIP 108061 / JCM 11494 / NBRC 100937 / ID131577) TaxID=469383 RepID=D3F4C0_CONWI|nr:AMP-binding protein [Conexibacter woesei]ADB50492.1 AMP-dependent synthetase and ligase [Conexibacter woesei DSM 14684]